MEHEPLPLADLPEAQKAALARWVMRCLARMDADDRAAAVAPPELSVRVDPPARPDQGRRSRARRPTPVRL